LLGIFSVLAKAEGEPRDLSKNGRPKEPTVLLFSSFANNIRKQFVDAPNQVTAIYNKAISDRQALAGNAKSLPRHRCYTFR
jgi:hypothetical protein